MCEHCASTDGARRAQNCALHTSVCFVVSVPLFAMWSRLFMSVCRSQMFVNMRCRIHSLYRSPRPLQGNRPPCLQKLLEPETTKSNQPPCLQKFLDLDPSRATGPRVWNRSFCRDCKGQPAPVSTKAVAKLDHLGTTSPTIIDLPV